MLTPRGPRTLAQHKPAGPRAPGDSLSGRLLTSRDVEQIRKYSEGNGSQDSPLQETEGINTERRKVRIDYVVPD